MGSKPSLPVKKVSIDRLLAENHLPPSIGAAACPRPDPVWGGRGASVVGVVVVAFIASVEETGAAPGGETLRVSRQPHNNQSPELYTSCDTYEQGHQA